MSGQPAKRTDRAPGEGFVVLWVNGPGAWEPTLQGRLADHGVQIEACDLAGLIDRVNRRAPDLVVLSGAAGSAPAPIARDLADSHPASSVPVIAIGPAADAQPKPRSRFGLVARLDKDAGVEALDKQLRTLLRSLSRRPARWRIPAARGELAAVVARLERAGRCGVLSLGGGKAVVLDGSAVSPDVEVAVKRLPPGDALELTLYERPRSRLRVLTTLPREDQTAPTIEGARILVVDPSASRGEKLAGRLEKGGASCRVAPPREASLSSAKSIDPTLVVVTAGSLLEATTPLWTDPRLSAASLLVLSDAVLDERDPEMALLGPVSVMCRAELSLARKLTKGEAVVERLETLGTTRWLKILGRATDDVTFRVYAATGRGRVDLSKGKIRGAAFRPADTRMGVVEGRAAIDLLMKLPFGRVLAGPPGKLKALEGVRKTRKTSMVGRIVPPGPGAPGKLAAELFVERVGAAATDLAARSSLANQTSGAPSSRDTKPARPKKPLVVPKPSAPPPEDDDADPLDALRRELGRAAGVSERPPPGDGGKKRKRKRKTKRPKRRSEAVTEPPDDEAEATPQRSDATPAPAPDEPVSIAPLPKPAAMPAEAEALAKEGRSSTLLYVAVTVAALAIGSYAAYRLAYDGSSGLEAVEPGPEVAPDDPLPDPEPDPPMDDEGGSAPDDPLATDAPVADEPTPTPPEPAIEPGPVEPPDPGTTVEELILGALEASRARDFLLSERLARQALALSPHNAQAGYRLAVALYRQRRYDEALQWAERAEQWDATTALPASLRGDIYLRTGRFVSAAEAYERALEIEPAFGPAQRQLANIRERRGIGPQRPTPPPSETPENPFE